MSSRAVSSKQVSSEQVREQLDQVLEAISQYLTSQRRAASSTSLGKGKVALFVDTTIADAAKDWRRGRKAKRGRRAASRKQRAVSSTRRPRRGPAKHRRAVRATVTATPKVAVDRGEVKVAGVPHVRLTIRTMPGTRVAVESCQRKQRRWQRRAEMFLWTGHRQWTEYEPEWMADADGVRYRVVVLPGSGKEAKP